MAMLLSGSWSRWLEKIVSGFVLSAECRQEVNADGSFGAAQVLVCDPRWAGALPATTASPAVGNNQLSLPPPFGKIAPAAGVGPDIMC
jgi:hypothetical protein